MSEKPKAKQRFCWNCGADMGVIDDRYYDRRDTCGKIECDREARYAAMTTAIKIMAKILAPNLYDDPAKGAFERAATMTVEAARSRAELERRVQAALLALAEMEPNEAMEHAARRYTDEYSVNCEEACRDYIRAAALHKGEA